MIRPYAKDMDPEVRHYLAEVIGCLQELVRRSPDAEFRNGAGLALVTIKANLMGREGQNPEYGEDEE